MTFWKILFRRDEKTESSSFHIYSIKNNFRTNNKKLLPFKRIQRHDFGHKFSTLFDTCKYKPV